MSGPAQRAIGVDDVLITAELDRRPSRAPDFQAESEALRDLAEAMANRPDQVLQRLVETALRLTGADSAGLSLLEADSTPATFRWIATAGAFAGRAGGTMPVEASPCGLVIARDEVLLFEESGRFFPAVRDIIPPVRENLLVPFRVAGRPIGTLWVMMHHGSTRFEREDARILQNLARFASAAHQMGQTLAATQKSEELRRIALEGGRMGAWRWDMRSGLIQGDAVFEALWGLPPGNGAWPVSVFASRVTPDAEHVTPELFTMEIEPGQEFDGQLHVGGATPSGRWIRWRARAERERPWIINGVSFDVTEQRLIDDRLTLLLQLSDALRPLTDPAAIKGEAARILGRHLRTDQAFYAVIDEEARLVTVERDHALGGAVSLDGAHSFEQLAPLLSALRQGEAVVTPLPATPPAHGPWRALLARALACVPIIKHGRLVAAMGVADRSARQWRPEELALIQDVAERAWKALEHARTGEAVRRKNAVLEGINRIFREALGTRSEEELGEICLEVAEDITGSEFSFMGEVDFAANRLNDLSVSARGWQRFAMADPRFAKGQAPAGFEIHGIYGRVLTDGRGLIANDPASHPDRIGTPEGHPPLDAFMGVPLIQEGRQDGRAVGMIGLANRKGGYRPEDLEAAQALAPAILQALSNTRAENALRKSEQRFQQFVDASSDVIWIRNAVTLRLEYLGQAFEAIYGQPLSTALRSGTVRDWLRLILPEDRRQVLASLRQGRQGRQVSLEYRIRRRVDGQVRWLHSTQFPLLDEAGQVQRVGGISEDVTEEKATADRLRVLVAELQHRTRNLLAVVRSLADKTMRRSATLQEFQARFQDRLAALARVNGLLSRLDDGRRIAFDELLRVELAALGMLDGQADRVVLDGPPGVGLRSSTVQTLALALHELATNALKYGALSEAGGQLEVRWRLAQPEGAPQLEVDWREHGVTMPKAGAALTGGGYGRELIERALPYQLNAKTTYELGPDGVRCRIMLPVSGSCGRKEATHG
ncbi:MAG TPA: GAF domain-containing protein [Geminicoccus sp.]|uniref:GAF domain-containing protein n=1 Tax=Geminicoccus sp. TaxID=2024832 RepID=UPI002CBBBE52|nr:GAF domain-containing protein [Geminicoccus sp.]HWL71238.1 GAF domain-containing protein [Geminicoccus sp.]